MSKIIATYVGMPDRCFNCPFASWAVDKDYNQSIACLVADKIICESWEDIHDDYKRQDWCPLHPLPERRERGESVMYHIGEPLTEKLMNELIDFGFDECLDALELGEMR